jgi:phosphoribosylanthranilate isomerase
MTLIKICGITSENDRDMCLSEGADLIGINVYPGSRRYVRPEMVEKLTDRDSNSRIVLVGVNNNFGEWGMMIDRYKPGYIQLHGNEELDIIKKLKDFSPETLIIKKVTIDQSGTFESVLEYADYLLCDTQTNEHGGSGTVFNWKLLGNINDCIRQRLFVAGGVNPDNIEELLQYDILGIDVASGSELAPGKKDLSKVKELIEKVRNYE